MITQVKDLNVLFWLKFAALYSFLQYLILFPKKKKKAVEVPVVCACYEM